MRRGGQPAACEKRAIAAPLPGESGFVPQGWAFFLPFASLSGGIKMRAVVQRVSRAQVSVDGELCSQIGKGMLVLLGVAADDTPAEAEKLAQKIAGLRIFEDAQQKMNLSLSDVGGQMLVVSQFTLLGDCRKGRRPSFTDAAGPELAETLYEVFVNAAAAQGIAVATGRFRAHMEVELVNDGPVTLLLDSRWLS